MLGSQVSEMRSQLFDKLQTALDQKQPLTSRLGVMDQGSCFVKIKDRDELKN